MIPMLTSDGAEIVEDKAKLKQLRLKERKDLAQLAKALA